MASFPSLRQLRYFVALADTLHFGRAARATNVSQSTLSAGVKELEETLGAALVDRTQRRVVLTPLGHDVLARARALLREAEEIVHVAAAAAEPLAGPLRLGAIPTVSPYLLPRVLPALRKAHPRLKLYLVEDITARLVESLEAGRLDVVLLALPCDCGAAETMVVHRDPFQLALPRTHPLAGRGQVPVEAIRDVPLLLLADGHCLRGHALAACGLPPARAGEGFAATSLTTLVQMVDNGLGLTLLPQIAIDAGILRGTDVVARPVEGEHAFRELGLAWRAGTARRAEFAQLGEELAKIIATLPVKSTVRIAGRVPGRRRGGT
jgi:LysR family hydrogen peroxide-inducible transcriptional activator